MQNPLKGMLQGIENGECDDGQGEGWLGRFLWWLFKWMLPWIAVAVMVVLAVLAIIRTVTL